MKVNRFWIHRLSIPYNNEEKNIKKIFLMYNFFGFFKLKWILLFWIGFMFLVLFSSKSLLLDFYRFNFLQQI